MTATTINRDDVFHFDGLPGATVPAGLTRPAGTLPDMDPTAVGNVLVRIEDIDWTGNLLAVRGHKAPGGELIFPDTTPEHLAVIPLPTAVALIERGVWVRYRH